jgi:hypothetical protein
MATGAEQAEWWTKDKLRERIAASKKKMLRIPAAALALARKQAERKACLTRPALSRYCTKPSPSEKSERRGGRPGRTRLLTLSLHVIAA